MKLEISRNGFKEIEITPDKYLKKYIKNQGCVHDKYLVDLTDEVESYTLTETDIKNIEILFSNPNVYFTKSPSFAKTLCNNSNESCFDFYYSIDSLTCVTNHVLLNMDFIHSNCDLIIVSINTTCYFGGLSVHGYTVNDSYLKYLNRKYNINTLLKQA